MKLNIFLLLTFISSLAHAQLAPYGTKQKSKVTRNFSEVIYENQHFLALKSYEMMSYVGGQKDNIAAERAKRICQWLQYDGVDKTEKDPGYKIEKSNIYEGDLLVIEQNHGPIISDKEPDDINSADIGNMNLGNGFMGLGSGVLALVTLGATSSHQQFSRLSCYKMVSN